MREWTRRNFLIVLFILANIAIAAPAAAGWDDDFCQDGEDVTQCCTGCIFFCSCTL
jgi:hypothetical protein